MNQYVLYALGGAVIVMTGVAEFIHLLPAGTFVSVFSAVLGGVFGFHITNTSNNAPTPVTLGPGVTNIQTNPEPIPPKQGVQVNP